MIISRIFKLSLISNETVFWATPIYQQICPQRKVVPSSFGQLYLNFIYNRFHNRELMLKFSKNAHLHRIKNYTYNLYNSEDYNALDEAAWQN
jgi:hypothetical protein